MRQEISYSKSNYLDNEDTRDKIVNETFKIMHYSLCVIMG